MPIVKRTVQVEQEVVQVEGKDFEENRRGIHLLNVGAWRIEIERNEAGAVWWRATARRRNCDGSITSPTVDTPERAIEELGLIALIRRGAE
jgi:hypothetical protein